MKPEPVFEELWHAQVFALTVHLNEAGHFQWSDWADRFSATLAQHRLARDLNGGSDYFDAWLATLEGFLAETGKAEPEAVAKIKAAWETAYLSTPHGAPVRLPE